MFMAVMLMGVAMGLASAQRGEAAFETDVVPTSGGDLTITCIGHGTLMFEFNGKVIHVDPYGKLADYGTLPKADLILVTHAHTDHLDPDAVRKLTKPGTEVAAAPVCAPRLPRAVLMKNGDVQTLCGVKIEAVPTYNIVHKRDNGLPFHPKGEGNGYILTLGDKRVYVDGDTENTPEMKALKGIDVAFLPMNLPYTMTPAMVADAARAYKPRILYPYHYGETDPAELVKLLKDAQGTEVRIRRMR